MLLYISQYPQEKNNGPNVPVELRVNIWLGLSAVEKKFNSFAEGTFTVFAEMVLDYLFLFVGEHCYVFSSDVKSTTSIIAN